MMPSTISLTNGTRLDHQAASIAKERRSQHKILSSCAGSRVTPAFLVEVVSIGIAALARFPPTLFFACFIKANTIDDCHSMFSIALHLKPRLILSDAAMNWALVWPLGSSPALGNEANSDVIGGPHAAAIA
jgi:hypothetical protein